MIEIYNDLQSNVLKFKLSGLITAEDYENTLIPAIKEKLKKHRKIRILYHVTKEFKSYQLKAVIDDAKAGLMFFNAWEKIAVVSDVEWIINGVKAFSFIIPAKVKVFSNNEIGNARKWLYQNNI
ncbi:STAS/SEC14 domain-containing protein [Hippea maritima]|uniref:UspA domain-containing protein n=1 Tax=Hippea maritima (strain ATCC 700847 / DSM 10411 / MH2) TaxID=760142 RepID=F2LY86_HIPMA|nr:STAS/SEC14 domain-containing protein [Hippea maritima]AEA34409.1 hypothetical protein Hipma_1453 [Hippea maritima DSM 10411]